jgi:hypothetical protein
VRGPAWSVAISQARVRKIAGAVDVVCMIAGKLWIGWIDEPGIS